MDVDVDVDVEVVTVRWVAVDLDRAKVLGEEVRVSEVER